MGGKDEKGGGGGEEMAKQKVAFVTRRLCSLISPFAHMLLHGNLSGGFSNKSREKATCALVTRYPELTKSPTCFQKSLYYCRARRH